MRRGAASTGGPANNVSGMSIRLIVALPDVATRKGTDGWVDAGKVLQNKYIMRPLQIRQNAKSGHRLPPDNGYC